MKARFVLLVIVCLALGINSLFGYYYPDTDSGKKHEMNGIAFDQYRDFTKKWRLVTVRYREDSGELRMVYANEKAWQGMKSLSPNYKDGSVFAKVSFVTEDDPAFPSSRTPTGSKRYQFMVKNRGIYKETDGWGYALFDSGGRLFKEEVKAKTMACAACHRVVPERDFVFSRPLQLHQNSAAYPIPVAGNKSAIHFEIKAKTRFSGQVLSFLDKNSDPVESLEGELQKHGFSGTLDEVVPLLLARSLKTSRDSVLFLNENNFSLVRPLRKSDKCTGAETKPFRIVVLFNNKKVRDAEVCQ